MQMLIGDGFFMLQFASMLLFNTLRLKAMVFAMGPLLLFQNGKMALDILTYVKEPLQKSTFVRLIGQHDSVYLLIMFTLQVELMSLLDACSSDKIYLLNLIYVPLILYQVVKIMDNKQVKLANSFFPYVVIVFTAIGIYVNLAANVVVSKSSQIEQPSYPLYVPKPATVDKQILSGQSDFIGPLEEEDY